MDEHRREDVGHCAQARAEWVHELRNAVNAAGVTVALARRLAEKGDAGGSLEMLQMAEHAWGRCRDLLLVAGQATTMGSDDGFVRRPSEDDPARSAPPRHR